MRQEREKEEVKEMNMIKDSSRDALNYILSLRAVAGNRYKHTIMVETVIYYFIKFEIPF